MSRGVEAGPAQTLVGLSYPESTPRSIIAAFVADLADVPVTQRAVPDGMQYRAGVEWLMPTAFIVYLAKGYVDGFLNAAGEKHYKVASGAISKLFSRVGKAPLAVASQATGAHRPPQEFSRAISLQSDSVGLKSYKLLFRTDADENEIALSVQAFLKLIAAESADESTTHLVEWLSSTIVVTWPHLLHYDRSTGMLRELDPIPEDVREAQDRELDRTR